MKITRAEIEHTIQCGDGIAVTYRNSNGVARLLRWAERGRASHFVECLGGLDTFEETIGGGMRTNLYTYLRGTCDLKVVRVRGGLDGIQKRSAREYWLNLVGKGYGWESIKRTAVTIPIRRFIRPHFPRLANLLVDAARALLPGEMPDCSAAWVAGMRHVGANVLTGYRPEEVSPENLLIDEYLFTVAKWKAPVLVDE
jgi:hypothetical protein